MGFIAKVFRYAKNPPLAARVMYRKLQTFLFYRGDAVECPACKRRFGRFMPYMNSFRCPHCDSLERHRGLWFYFEEHPDLFTGNKRMLHYSPERVFYNKFSVMPTLFYVTTDWGLSKVRVFNDITSCAFRDDTFDLVLCNHVLEHVPDDTAAMRETLRILRPGGMAIFMIPIDARLEKTLEDPNVKSPEERRRLFGQEDHVRLYGLDFTKRLESAGFKVEVVNPADKVGDAQIRRYGLSKDDPIFVCRKTNASK